VKGSWLAAVAAILVMSAATPASSQEPASTLPGGASSLQEAYQDWRLSCQSAAPQPVCSISQEQTQENGQRVLAIELRKEGNDALSGNLILPFGLQLDAGAILQIDEGQQDKPLRFSTCLPAGCLVPLNFDAKSIAALRVATALRVKVQSMDAKEAALSISLKGFAAALDRLQVLGKT
jgi:invasion protein IalB